MRLLMVVSLQLTIGLVLGYAASPRPLPLQLEPSAVVTSLRSQPAMAASPPPPRLFPEELNLIYDSRCGVCQWEVDFLSARDKRGALTYTDLEADDWEDGAARNGGLDYPTALASFHAVRGDNGELLSGMEVFQAAYAAVGLGWVWKMYDNPLAARFLDWGYSLFARYRTDITRGSSLEALISARRAREAEACAAAAARRTPPPTMSAATATRDVAVVLVRPEEDSALADELQRSLGASMPLIKAPTASSDATAASAALSAAATAADNVVAIFELGLCVKTSMAVYEASEQLDADCYRFQPAVSAFKRLRGESGPTWLAAGFNGAASEDTVTEANGWGYLAGDEELVVDTAAMSEEELARMLDVDVKEAAAEAGGDDAGTVTALGYYRDFGAAAFAREQWTAEATAVLLSRATEMSATWRLADGTPFPDEGADGTYVSPLTGAPLFTSTQRRRSTTGWPSFAADAANDECLGRATDISSGSPRVEVTERSTGAHLGHDFEGSLCINAASLLFVPRCRPPPTWLPKPAAPAMAHLLRDRPEMLGEARVATLAGGCFWSLRRQLAELPGVLVALAGFAGGETTEQPPTYEAVCGGNTGFVEAVQLAYDPRQTSYDALLDAYWRLVPDPTSSLRQGADVGPQYESRIFFHGEEQRHEAVAARERAQEAVAEPIVTRLQPAGEFYRAAEEHQRR